MNQIIRHAISKEGKVPVYDSKDAKTIKLYLNKGEWMGITEEHQGFCSIISVRGTGIVKTEVCSSLNGYDLKINQTGNCIRYGISA